MKKIINIPEHVVAEMCSGIVLAHPELTLNAKYRILKKRDLNPNKVSLISGGGSGHELAHGGFIGKGMLDAAVCGDVFASPSQIQVYQAIKETAGNKGALLIIKNYSGDVMNFKNAAYLAEEDGIEVDYVKVDDDIAVQDSLYTVGRRGVAGTVLVHKIAGAAAEAGGNLQEVKAAAQMAIANLRSIGFALSSCTVPAKGTPTFEIGDDEMEYGVGIHGEPGIVRQPIISADALAERMTNALLAELKPDGKEVTLLINGFGATPTMELYLFHHAVRKVLHERGVIVYRAFVGNFMTSIDMIGASLTFMSMTPELKELLDSECDTPAFSVNGSTAQTVFVPAVGKDLVDLNFSMETNPAWARVAETFTVENIIFAVDCMADCIIRNEVLFCELDSHAGDGDFGMSVAKGFKQLKREWKELTTKNAESISEFLNACSIIIMEHCGGASGPIWGSAFRGAAKATLYKPSLCVTEFAQMMQAALESVQKTGERSFGRGAVVGDKTLVDALDPCVSAWNQSAVEELGFQQALAAGAAAAVAGAQATEQFVARMGRAGTVGERSIGYPDAGAYGLGVIFTDIANAMKFE